MKIAIADAMMPVTDSLCGSATAMLASTSSEGSATFEYFNLDTNLSRHTHNQHKVKLYMLQ